MTNLKHLYFLTLVLLAINPTYLISQKLVATDTLSSSYKNLSTLKNYGISFSSMVSGDSSWFKIGDNKVDEKTYKKFTKYSDNIDNCKPCILLSYDTSENLRLKRITYGDCCVGYWIEYFANGLVKVIGHFKENTTGKWDNIFEKGYCREDGVWTYFNNNGKQLYSEIWKEGKLIKKIKSKTN